MGEPKEVYNPLLNAGLILKQDPSLLKPGQYSVSVNVNSPIEGVLSVRGGTQNCFRLSVGSVFSYLHSMARLLIPSAATARYIGIGPNLSRSLDAPGAGMGFTQLSLPSSVAGTSTSSDIASQRWSSADYGSEGFALIYKFFATPTVNMKDNGSFTTLQVWGVFGPTFPATGNTTGGPTVGPAAFTGAEVPYTYVYTYLNTVSGAESNPSDVMIPTNGVTPNGYQIEVRVRGTNDPQILTNTNSINIYRAGGSFGDGLYRFVGNIMNPTAGANPLLANIVNFYDTATDQQILSNQLLSTDNDPPVPAGLPIQFTMPAACLPGSGSANSVARAIYLSAFGGIIQGPAGFWPSAGDIITVSTGSGTAYIFFEATVIAADASMNEIDFYTQYNLFHVLTALNLTISCSTHTGSPCTLALTAFNSIFLAGDAYNPNFLYQSKPNQPESFPVIQQGTGIVQGISVGTPANPINGIAEYSGAVVCLNLENIFLVAVYNNQMQNPIQTPARHGLITPNAWVKVSNEIWYLSYDGIYSFSGGQEKWVSEALDPLFKGETMNGYLPINLTAGQGGMTPPVGLDVITMTTVDNDIIMNYTDTAGNNMRLRYELNFNRWNVEKFYGGTQNGLYMQFSEPDTGLSWIGINVAGAAYPQPGLDLVDTGTTDGWIVAPNSGTPIAWQWSPTIIDQQAKTDKLFSDFQLECASTDTVNITTRYNWSNTNDLVDIFAIPAGTRQRYPFPFQKGTNGPEGMLAYAQQLLFFGSATGATNFYTIGLHYTDLTDYTAGFSRDYSDLGYVNDKILRNLTVEIDTGGVAATGYIDMDGQAAVYTFQITTTYYDRKRIIPMPSNLVGRMIRDRYYPGTGGKTNFYKSDWDYLKEPAAVDYFDSYEFNFSYNGFSFLKQAWWEYQCPSPITINFYVSNDVLFYSVTLPAHTWRDVERFYFYSVLNGVLNKSKVHRFTVTSASRFKIYKTGTRIEWLPCGADQRGDYEQLALSEMMGPE